MSIHSSSVAQSDRVEEAHLRILALQALHYITEWYSAGRLHVRLPRQDLQAKRASPAFSKKRHVILIPRMSRSYSTRSPNNHDPTVEQQEYIEAHLRQRYVYFPQSELKRSNLIRESTGSYTSTDFDQPRPRPICDQIHLTPWITNLWEVGCTVI